MADHRTRFTAAEGRLASAVIFVTAFGFKTLLALLMKQQILVECKGRIRVHKSLLNDVLRDQLPGDNPVSPHLGRVLTVAQSCANPRRQI